MKSMIKNNTFQRIFVLIFLVTCTYLIFTNDVVGIYADTVSLVVFFTIAVLSGEYLFHYDKHFWKKYVGKKSWIFILIIAALMAFILAGQPLFLDQVRIYISLKRLLFYGMMVIWCIPIELYILYLLEFASEKFKKNKKVSDKKSKKVFIVTFLLLLMIWSLVFIFFYPGTMTPDSVDQYLQAIGRYPLSNAHPVVMTLLLRLTLLVTKSTSLFIYLQIIFFSLLLSCIFKFLYRHGVSDKIIYAFCVLFAILPSSYLFVITLWKDVGFTIALLWMTYLILKMILNEKQFFSKKINYLYFIIATMIVSFFRHNGIGPFVFIILYFLYLIIRYRKKSYMILSSLLVVCYISITLVIRVLCPSLPSKEQYSSLLNLVSRSSGQILQTTNLPKYTEDIIQNYASLELLKSEYDPYSVDSYGFNPKMREYRKTIENPVITTSQAIMAYANNLIYHPMDTIKERLDGTDILWSMKQSYRSFNHRYAIGLWFPANLSEEETKLLHNNISNKIDGEEPVVPDNKVAQFLINFAYSFGNYFILDNLISRAGIYVILLLIVTFFLWKNNRKLYPVYLPLLGNTATWVLLLAYQAYRYVWYIQIVTIFILVCTIVFSKKKEVIEL